MVVFALFMRLQFKCSSRRHRTSPMCQVMGPQVVILGIVSLLFGMFTCCMILDQWDAITKNVSKIDRLKAGRNTIGRGEAGLEINEIFGTNGFTLSWLVPSGIQFEGDMEALVMGYVIEGEGELELTDLEVGVVDAAIEDDEDEAGGNDKESLLRRSMRVH